ncbi:ribonuclease H2, subunit C [Russula compacta]|nr:ribonuclease H2, subunit C [Russula compacta]
MAASTSIAHGHANRDLPVRIPHLMPFHIQHSGPAPISTYFRIRPHDDPSEPSSLSNTSPPSGESRTGLTAAGTNSSIASEETENAPDASYAVSLATATVAKAPASRMPRTGAIGRLSESAKRFISSFRGRTVHGVEVALPNGFAGIVLRGDPNGKTHQATSKTPKRQPARQLRRKPTEGEQESARFDSFVLWHPDIAVDEGKDEYLRSLSEWVNIATEIHRVDDM